MATGRTRNYAFIVYPETAPFGWFDILDSQHIPCFISPLHSAVKGHDETERKDHFHVLLMFDSVKTYKQAKEISDLVLGSNPIPINSTRGYARYLLHLDNPEKQQFGENGVNLVKSLCGADYIEAISLPSDRLNVIREMIEFCERYNINSFYLLARYAAEHNESWHRALTCSCTVYMKNYLQSRTWSVERQILNIVNPDTGEIIM